MAIDYNRISWIGTLAGGEIWSTACSFNTDFGTGPVKSFEDLADWAAAVGAISWAGYPSISKGLSSIGRLTGVRAEYIDSTGHVSQLALYTLPSAFAGSASPASPFQVAAVASLLTGRPGRSYRGRMYWPALGFTLSTTTAKLSTTDQQELANNVADLLTKTGAAAGVDFAMVPVVASQVKGVTTPISTVRVGSVLDTQRRRRNSEVEAYLTADIPYVAG